MANFGADVSYERHSCGVIEAARALGRTVTRYAPSGADDDGHWNAIFLLLPTQQTPARKSRQKQPRFAGGIND